MKRMKILCLVALFLLVPAEWTLGAEKKGEYPLPGDVREGWRVFIQKKCGECHAIWGEGGKGGPDLGTLPQAYVNQAQLAALMWNHGP
jgi:mono/diheme cytochrome c family protein